MKIAVPDNGWRVAEALAMKGWLETRWRLIGLIGMPAILIAAQYSARYDPRAAGPVLLWMWVALSCGVELLDLYRRAAFAQAARCATAWRPASRPKPRTS